MLTCKQASQLISRSLDRPLLWHERLQLKLHLLICDPCTQFKRQLNQLRVALKRMRTVTENDTSIQLPLEVKNRISHVIASKQQ